MAQEQAPCQSVWANVPKEIVETLGLYLDASGWAAARSTCVHWSKSITHGITLLEIDLERDAHRWMMVLTCVARLFPRLTSIALLCGSRITPAVFAERMAALSITSIQLQELELRFLYLSSPMLGTWLENVAGVTELRGLRLLRLAGGATPTAAFFESLTKLKQLRVLEVLPGVYGQIAGYDMDMGQGNAEVDPFGGSGVANAHLSAIGRLTQLQQVTVKVSPQGTTPEGLAGLTSLGLLDNLEHLALYDAELPCDSLAHHLAGASRLSSLQFGLSSITPDLATLKKLPKLQEVGLDTAFLPSLSELVGAARAAHIPTTGPGSITSLCSLDQTVGDAHQLACLSHLSSLAELVLVNPLVQQPPPSPPSAPPSPAPHHHQQQQQAVIDISVLSSLCSLRLLQVDVGSRGSEPGDSNMAPLPLCVSESSLRALASAWTCINTLDLSGFGPDMLPEAALSALSCLSTLRALSLMHPGGSPHLAAEDDAEDGDQVPDPPLLPGMGVAAAAAVAAGSNGGSSGSNDGSSQRGLPWWHLPKGLMSLCLSHMDLTGRGVTQCGELPARSGSGCSGGCCLVAAAAGQQQQPRQQLLPGLSLSLFQSKPTPLRPLSKRRRQTQQRTDQQEGTGGGTSSSGGFMGGIRLYSDTGSAAAAGAAAGDTDDVFGDDAYAAQAPRLCSCAALLAGHFSGLQALWLERVTLPASFLLRVLPALAGSLESLALLHVAGTQQEELGSLSTLTAVTSLRLIPADHDLGGLDPLLTMRHLKKLNLKLTHLRPSDLSVLSKLRSLFCLSLCAPCVNGSLYPGFASAVRLQQVQDVVDDSLQYCDLELQPEPNMTAMP